jgi:hypothetical protein
MLQLTASTRASIRPQFSKAQIADMTRGAKVVVRRITAKPDGIARELVRFKALVTAHAKASAQVEKVKAILQKRNAMYAGVYINDLDPEEGRSIVFGNRSFFLEVRLIEAVAKSRSFFREELSAIRALPKYSRTGNNAQLMRERDQREASLKRRLARLPDVEKKLIKQLRSETRRVQKIQRSVRWLGAHKAYSRAHARLWQSFEKMTSAAITSRSGAIALIDLAGIVLQTNILYAGELPAILSKATLFLASSNTADSPLRRRMRAP